MITAGVHKSLITLANCISSDSGEAQLHFGDCDSFCAIQYINTIVQHSYTTNEASHESCAGSRSCVSSECGEVM